MTDQMTPPAPTDPADASAPPAELATAGYTGPEGIDPRGPRRGSRFAALLCLLTAIAAVGVVVAGASSDDPTPPPSAFAEAVEAERELAAALVARDGRPETGDAIRAARATISELEAISAGPLSEPARRARASRRVLVKAIGSVLNNPRSPLAADLADLHEQARSEGRAANLPLPEMVMPGPR